MSLVPRMASTSFLEYGHSRLPYIWGFGIAGQLASCAEQLNADRFVIVTDQRVQSLYADRFEQPLKSLAPVNVLTVGTGETHKSWANLQSLCEAFIQLGATRRTCIVALGGGVIGNLGAVGVERDVGDRAVAVRSGSR